ncbi:MAG: hypothetical protein JOZ18_01215 [Chloroflexi bacterium]|nr:hypothetical protein [Chloroflexota bacterium]
MPPPEPQKKEQPGTYFVQDRSNQEELARLQILDQMITAGTPEGQHFYENMRLAYRTIVPFLRKWTRFPGDYETIYQQAQVEMQQPGFVATWRLLTAWGTNVTSGRDKHLFPR